MDTTEQLSQVFASFAGGESLSKDDDAMDGRAWVKCLKDCSLLGKGVTITDADLIFATVKPRGGRRIDLAGFQRALALLAKKKGVSEFSVVWQVANSLGPKYSNGITVGPSPEFGPERFYYDTGTYTGTWKQGGPTPPGSKLEHGGYSNVSVNRSVVQDDAINRAKQGRAGGPSRMSSRGSSATGSITSSARRPSTISTNGLSRSDSRSSISSISSTSTNGLQRHSSRASQSRRASAPTFEIRGASTNKSSGDTTSRSETTVDFGSSKPVDAAEDVPLFTGRSDSTIASLTLSNDVEAGPLSELAALCSDDIPCSETRRDPVSGKVWTYSAYRSAHIAEKDLLCIRSHWLSNCSLVTKSEAATQEFVGSWLPPPRTALVEHSQVSNNEPEAEVDSTQDVPPKRVIEDEILPDESQKPSKVSNLPQDMIDWTTSQEFSKVSNLPKVFDVCEDFISGTTAEKPPKVSNLPEDFVAWSNSNLHRLEDITKILQDIQLAEGPHSLDEIAA